MKAAPSPRRSAFDALADARHHDPFSFLGPHVADGGVAIRVMLPNAGQATLIRPGADPSAMERRHPAGGFEVLLEGVHEIPDYRLRVRLPGRLRGRDRRPVSLRPHRRRLRSLPVRRGQPHTRLRHARRASDAHRRLRRRALRGLGARTPHRVSVVGDFNDWDGRAHPMRELGSSGVWEIFIPASRGRAALQVRVAQARRPHPGQDRSLRARLRMPPLTASIVDPLGLPVERRPTGCARPRRPPTLVPPADRRLRGPPRLVARASRRKPTAT